MQMHKKRSSVVSVAMPKRAYKKKAMSCRNNKSKSYTAFRSDDGEPYCVSLKTLKKNNRAKSTKSPSEWNLAVKQARDLLEYTGFVPIGGKTPEGQTLHETALLIRTQMKQKQL